MTLGECKGMRPVPPDWIKRRKEFRVEILVEISLQL